MSSMAAKILSFSSCLETTRMCRSTDRASLEKKPSIRLSQEPRLGVKVKAKRLPAALPARLWSPSRCERHDFSRISLIGFGRVSRIEKLETFDELAAAVTILDQG